MPVVVQKLSSSDLRVPAAVRLKDCFGRGSHLGRHSHYYYTRFQKISEIIVFL